MPDPIGHIDFYPNGGNTNPGCDKPMQHYILSTGRFEIAIRCDDAKNFSAIKKKCMKEKPSKITVHFLQQVV